MIKSIKQLSGEQFINSTGNQILSKPVAELVYKNGLIYDYDTDNIQNVGGYCKTMYNYVSGGTDFVQNTVANQPLIVPKFIGSKTALLGGSFTTTINLSAYTVFMVINTGSNAFAGLTINGANVFGTPYGNYSGGSSATYYRNNLYVASGNLSASQNVVLCVYCTWSKNFNVTYNGGTSMYLMAIKIYNRYVNAYERRDINTALGSSFSIAMEA